MKSKSIKHSIIILIILASFTGCKKDIVDDPNKVDYETDLEQFEAVWNGLNTAYVFWSVDSTDWDAVYKSITQFLKKWTPNQIRFGMQLGEN